MFDNSFLACTFFFFFPFLILSGDQVAHINCSPSARISPQWLSELSNCDRVFHDQFHVSSFLDRLPHDTCTAALSVHSELPWVKGVCVFRCNLPPALWQNERSQLRATAVTGGIGNPVSSKENSWTGRRHCFPMNSRCTISCGDAVVRKSYQLLIVVFFCVCFFFGVFFCFFFTLIARPSSNYRFITGAGLVV